MLYARYRKSGGFEHHTGSCSQPCVQRREGAQLCFEQEEAPLLVASHIQSRCTDAPAKNSWEKKNR